MQNVKNAQLKAWSNYIEVLREEKNALCHTIESTCDLNSEIESTIFKKLQQENIPNRRMLISSAKKIIREIKYKNGENKLLENWLFDSLKKYTETYSSHLYSESKQSIHAAQNNNIVLVKY